MDLWGDKGGAPMHALHFGYPLGAMIGPLLAYPFVSIEDTTNTTSETTTLQYTELSNPRYADDSRIEIPYVIVGIFLAILCVTFFIFQCIMPSKNIASHQHKQGYKWKDVFSPAKWSGDSSNFGLLIISLTMLFFALHIMALKASTYYMTYAVDEVGYTNQQATLYQSLMSFAGTLGRAASIVFAYFVPIQVMLITEVHGQVIFAILTLLWGLDDKLSYLVFSCFFTFFRDPIWPSAYTWTDQYIALYAVVVGLIDMATNLTGAVFSWLLGYLYTYTVPDSIFYNTVAAAILLCILVWIMNYIAQKHGSRFSSQAKLTTDINITDTLHTHVPPVDEKTKL